MMGWPRQAIFSRDGAFVFLSAWESPVLSVVDAKARKIVREVGPFTSYLCPFTINGRASQVFANVDGLVGFEVGDLQTGLDPRSRGYRGIPDGGCGEIRVPEPRHRVDTG